MLFNSYSFLLFFPLVLIAVGLVPARWKNPVLLLASYYFYSCFSKRYCLLLLGCTAMPEKTIRQIEAVTLEHVTDTARRILSCEPCLAAAGKGATDFE